MRLNYLPKLLLLAASLLGALLVCELVIRRLQPALPQELTTLAMVYSDEWNHSLPASKRRSWKLNDESYDEYFNQLGLANAEVVVPKPMDVYRVLVVGDSFIQGYGTNSIPRAVSDALEPFRSNDGRKFEVINCGQSSYSALLQHARYLHQYRSLQPDALIYFPDLTDVFDDNVRYRHLVVYDNNGNVDRVGYSRDGYVGAMMSWGFQSSPSYLYKLVLRSVMQYRWRSNKYGTYQETPLDMWKLSENIKNRDRLPFSVSAIESFLTLVSGDPVTGGGSVRHDRVHVACAMYPHEKQITGEWSDVFTRAVSDMCMSNRIPFRSFQPEMAAAYHESPAIYRKNDMHYSFFGLKVLGTNVAQWIVHNPKATLGTSFAEVNSVQ